MMASVMVSPRFSAVRRAASQRSSGTRTARCGVFGWFGNLSERQPRASRRPGAAIFAPKHRGLGAVGVPVDAQEALANLDGVTSYLGFPFKSSFHAFKITGVYTPCQEAF